MDPCDVSQLTEERIDELRIADARARMRDFVSPRPSATHCVNADCGIAIPEERRRAVPGVQLCIDCQSLAEKRLQK